MTERPNEQVLIRLGAQGDPADGVPEIRRGDGTRMDTFSCTAGR